MNTTSWWRKLVWRLRALTGRDALERDLTEEMQVHIDMEVAELMRTRGLDPVQARRQALLGFGNVQRFKEEHRDARGIRWARTFFDATAPFASGGVYVNFMTDDETSRVRNAYGANYDRLARIKQAYDPLNLFRSNQNIAPAS